MRVGFIGLGNMGLRMAKNLIKNDHRLIVHDKNPAAVAALKVLGADVASSASEVAEASQDAIVTMLPSSEHVREVYLGSSGILSGDTLRPPLLIDCSTIDPETAREVAAKAVLKTLQAGAGDKPLMVDAPVSGGVTGAEAATLTFMVGGDEAAFRAAEPLLACMGQRSVHCGPAGNGQAAKVCNNLALGIQMAGVSEALALGKRLGLDPGLLSSIFNTSTSRCWSSDTYNPVPGVIEGVPSGRDYEGGFGAALMAKDLRLAQCAAASYSSASPFPMGTAALELYSDMESQGAGVKDFSGVFKYKYGSGN